MDEWRIEIDAIDDALLRLLNERAVCAVEIGRLKRAQDLEIYSPVREAEVLRRVTEGNGGPLAGEAVKRLFERIIDESRSIERTVGEDEGTKERQV